MRIIGVDFSGAERETGKTYLAQGWLEGNNLTLASSRSVSRDQLTGILRRARGPVVAAMDFPFSVPEDFARHCHIQMPDVFPDGGEMPDLWAAVADTEWELFENIAHEFGCRPKSRGERKWPVRECDQGVTEAKSPLQHKVNPDMLPMTFQGMKMLHCLWNARAVLVPPLPQPSRPGKKDTITLLEVMPGAVLRSLELPFTRYKDGKQPLELRLGNRERILDNLPERASPLDVNLPHYIKTVCRQSHDALDAVVAAIAAALWAMPGTREHFISPPNPANRTVRLEGWLYTPGGCYLHNCVGRI